jgi:hypothetical protein
MDRLNALIQTVKKQCPTIGSVSCIVYEEQALLHIHYSYPNEIETDSKTDEDSADDEDSDFEHDRCTHMFLYPLVLTDEDWSHHEQRIVERYHASIEKGKK